MKGELDENWHQMVPGMFRDLIEQDLPVFNQIREVRRYDALECMQVWGIFPLALIPRDTEDSQL